MIDTIVRKSYNEYVIIYTNRPPVTVHSSGNALTLLKFMLGDKTYEEMCGIETTY